MHKAIKGIELWSRAINAMDKIFLPDKCNKPAERKTNVWNVLFPK